MKLTTKDKDFLEKLRKLMDDKELVVDLKECGMKRLVLRKNYGDKVERAFGMTRQGVRWRFNHIFNDIYISTYESLYLIESAFGTDLRKMALDVARERVELRKKAPKITGFMVCRRETDASRLKLP